MKTHGQNWKSKCIKASVMIAGAAMTMGNQKCEQVPEQSARSLKKIVDLGAMKSPKISFPDGSYFDFQFVANQQVQSVLLDSDKFTFKYKPPIATAPENLQTPDDMDFFNLSKADAKMMKSFSQAAGKENFQGEYSQTSWCLVNVPQAKIQGSVNAFELVGGAGLTLGFNGSGSHSGSGLTGLGFDVSWAQLDLSLFATSPLTTKVLGKASVNSKQTKTRVNFTLNLGVFAVGPSAYYQTPLAKVTETALKKAVTDLAADLDKQEWFTRVLANHDRHLLVVGGNDVGLKAGDQLLVYNEYNQWTGKACDSEYKGTDGSSPSSAVAKIQIVSVGDEISRGLVIEQNDFTPEIGAKVKLFKFRADDFKEDEAGVDQGEAFSGSNRTSSQGNSTVGSTKPGRI